MKRYRERKALLVLLIFAFIFRVWGIGYGLPLFIHLDENTIARIVMGMIKTGDLNPHYFRYPSLYPYFIRFIALISGLITRKDFSNVNNLATIYLLGRFSSALISTATVYLTYLLGKKFFSQKIGFLAAVVFSVMFLPVYLSHFMITDMLALFFLLMALILSFKVYQKGELKDYFWAGLFSGLLIGTKFNVFVFIPLVFAHFFPAEKSKKRLFSQLVIALVIAGLAFLITNPYFLPDWKNYLSGFWSQVALQRGDEVLMMSDKDGIPTWWWYCQYWFYSGLGFSLTLSSLLGIIIGVLNNKKKGDKGERRKFFFFVLFPVFYLVTILLSHHRGDRYSLPLMPILAIFSGVFLEKIITFLQGVINNPKLRIGILFFLFLVLLGPSIYKAVALDYLISQKDTRVQAGEWIEKNYSKDQLILPIANATQTGEYLQMKNFNRVINLFHMRIEDTFLYPDQLFLINSSDYHFAQNYQSIPEYKKFLENYQLIKEKGELVKEFSQPLFNSEFFSPFYLEHSSTVNAYHNPTTEIYKIPYLPEFYQEIINFEYKPEEMLSNMVLKEKEGKKYLWADGKEMRLITSPNLLFPKGDYVLEYKIQDWTCLDSQADALIAVATYALIAVATLGRKEIIAQKNYLCYQLLGYNKVVLEFNLEKASGIELLFGGNKGVSFLIEGVYLQGELPKR